MADYNVNMKQWNGTSFDNVLPLAYNALALNGQTLQDIQNGELQMIRGSYIGTGLYGSANPNTITVPFTPQLVFIAIANWDGGIHNPSLLMRPRTTGSSRPTADSYSQLTVTWGDNSVSWYMNGTESPYYQLNVAGEVYYWNAIGKIGDIDVEQSEFILTTSGTFVVNKTGRYLLELYGGGGGTSRSSGSSGYTGGASCQHYDSISLTKGTNIAVTIAPENTTYNAGGTTTFGSYSVSGGGGSSTSIQGAGAGNRGADGAERSRNQKGSNYGTGVYSTKYGYGAGSNNNNGGPGAVYLKYLGT